MTTNKSRIFARISVLTLAFALFAPLVVNAASITSGSLTMSDSRPNQTAVSYTFAGSGFTTATSIQCIQLKLSTAATGGTKPAGITTTSSTFGSSTIAPSGWIVNNTVDGSLRITHSTGASPVGTGNIVWNGVTNGSTADTTYFGQLTTYTNIDCATGPIDSTVVAFMYKDGALVTMTVDPTLIFTVAAVGSGLAVNGQNTTVATTATTVPFGNSVSAATNGVSAHDVTVATNGGGFALYLKQSGNFAFGANIIDPSSGNNGTPVVFSGVGTEAWGYTTNDPTLTQFSSNKWAGMPTVNELVGDLAAAGSQTTRVGHQLGLSTSTPAGSYTTNLVYTAAGTY